MSKKLRDTITKVNLPKFDDKYRKQKSLKPTAQKLGDAQKHVDVARARGISTKEILCFDHLINNKFFEENLTLKPEKKGLSEGTGETSYFFRLQFHFRKSAEDGCSCRLCVIYSTISTI